MNDDERARRDLFKVFLSSTSVDLTQHRAAVSDVIRRFEQLPLQMETFGALPGAPVAECRRLIAKSDAVVVVVAHRYGWIPSVKDGGDGEKSITWHEVDAAIAAGKEVFAYLVDKTEPAPADDADTPRLERFRAFLGERVRDTFSSPDDLAKKVSVALAHWIINSRNDFPRSLQALDIAEADRHLAPAAALLGLADILPVSLLSMALSGHPIELTQFDQALAGRHVRAATEQRDVFVHHGKQHLDSMRANVSRIESEKRDLEAKIRSIESESPPRPPEHQLISRYDMSDDQRLFQQEKLNREYQEAVSRHALAMQEYNQRKVDLPGHRQQRNPLQQRADQIRSQIAVFEQSFEAEYLELGRAIVAARGRDVVHLLAGLRDFAARDLNDRATATRGFVRLLAAQLLATLTQDWLEPSSTTAAELIAQDIAHRTDQAVRDQLRAIGYEPLRRFAMIDAALKQNEKAMSCIRAVLDALPSDELARAGSGALEKVQERFSAVPAYNHISDPAELKAMKATLATSREHILAAQRSRQALLDGTSGLLGQVTATRAEAMSHRSRIEDVANRFRPHLAEIDLLWRLLARAQKVRGLGETAKVFTSALQLEATRRCGGPFATLMDVCERSGFLLNDADSALSSHPSTAFIKSRDALIAQLGRLQTLQQKYDFALPDIENVPKRMVEKYAKTWRLHAIGAVIPFVNVLCAALFVSDLFRLKAALRSSVRCYVDLNGLGAKLCALMVAVSLLVLGLSLYFLYPIERLPPSIDPTWAIATLASYALALVLSLWSLIKLWAYRRGKPRTGKEAARVG